MSELEHLLQAMNRQSAAGKEALIYLDKIVYEVKERPDALLVLSELHRFLGMMLEKHERNEARKPQVRPLTRTYEL